MWIAGTAGRNLRQQLMTEQDADMMMMMKLPILPCAEKLDSQFCLPHQKHEITPTKTVKTENGPISRGSQFEVSMVRDLWGEKIYQKGKF